MLNDRVLSASVDGPAVAARAAMRVGCSAQRVDPALGPARMAHHDVRVAEAVGQERGALYPGDELEGEVVSVAPSQRGELLLRPADQDSEVRSCFSVQPVIALVELLAQAALRAAVASHEVGLVGP